MIPATRHSFGSSAQLGSLRPATLAACLALALSAPLAAAANPQDSYSLAAAQRKAAAAGQVDRSARPAPIRHASTLPVTSCADDGTPGTLREVLKIAGEGDTVDLSQLTCSTITLAAGALDAGVFGPHHVYQLNLVGPGRDRLTIDARGASQVLVHNHFRGFDGALSISDLTIANGTYVGGLPGCVHASGNVTLTRVDIRNCRSSGGGPLFAAALGARNLVMHSSTVTGSAGSTTGTGETRVVLGTVYSADTELVDSTISGNTVTSVSGGNDQNYFSGGGGLYVKGNLSMSGSTISGNSAITTGTGFQAVGGGVFVTGTALIRNSTIEGNRATGTGGGVMKGVYSVYGDSGTTLTISNSTISGNVAAQGAGVGSARPTTVSNSTIAFNEASTGAGGVMFREQGFDNLVFDFQSAIIANNSGGSGSGADLGSTGNLQITGSNNLIVDGGSLALPSGTLATDPMLQALANNGGRTRTHALLKGSPAIDVGNNGAQLNFDQRGDGFPRLVGAAVDIGAFEWSAPVVDLIFRDGFDVPIVYRYDDGDGDTNLGPPSSFSPDMLWGNYYLTQTGGEVITRISVAFGPTFPSLANGPVTFWLLDDPDMDMDPRNATALIHVQGTPDVVNDAFFSVEIPPTRVSGAFFVGASAKLAGGQDRPARVDTDAPGDKSWFFYAPEIADVIDNLASAPYSTRMDNAAAVLYPGAFMIRATGQPAD
jgi:hypothetical protein